VIALRVQTNFIQPSVEILNIRIDEPITTITDILLALICLYGYIQIRKLEHGGRCKSYFLYYFLVLGLGALTGGLLGHAFQYRLAEEWKLVSWILTPVSVALMVQALLEVARPFLTNKIVKMISWFNLLVFFPVLVILIWSMDFSLVKYYSIFGYVVLAGSLCYYIYQRSRNKGVLFIIGGVGIGIISAIIFSLEWGFSAWFNHRDLSHMILCFSVFYAYKGARLTIRSMSIFDAAESSGKINPM